MCGDCVGGGFVEVFEVMRGGANEGWVVGALCAPAVAPFCWWACC